MKAKAKSAELQRAVAAVKADISPKEPCIHADADGYCTGPCEGALCFKCQNYKPATAVAAAPQPPPIHLETPHAATPAEAVRFDLGMARKHGAMTLAYLARAGWRLALEKQGLNHGAWYDWCENNLGISHSTVDRYIKFYYSTVGAYLRAQGTAHRLVDNLTDAMIEAATAELESKTATGAMIELGIVKRPSGWGGEREGAGRKPKGADVAAELKAVTEHEAVLWASAKGALDTLVQLDSDRDFMRRLTGDHLAQLSGILADLSTKAAKALEDRILTEAEL